MRDFLMIGVVAATLGTLLAPLVQHIARRVGFVDRPDRHHKRHRRPVPLGGGLLIFVSAVTGLAAVAAISPVAGMLIDRDAMVARGFLLASLTLITIGVLDDWRGMRGRHKLAGQIVAALLLVGHGLEIRQLELLGWTFDLGVMAVPFTVFWLLGAINALNLLDGIDGLAGTVGLITSLVLAVVAIISGHAFGALIAVAVAGGCAAFVHANLPPARMFLGDTGSMLLGLALGALTALCCLKGPGLLSLAPAVGLLAIPIMDSSAALLRRRLTGRSIYATDRGHLHHCLMHALESHHATLLVAALAIMASGLGAAFSVYTKNDVTAILSTGLVIALLVFMRLFGHVECALLVGKVAMPLLRLLRIRTSHTNGSLARNVVVRLQGELQWDLLWESLTELAEKLQLLRLNLDVNLPAMKEGFHANWYQPTRRESHECWWIEVPLFLEGIAVGRLEVAGEPSEEQASICDSVDQLLELLGPFEQAFAALAASATAAENGNLRGGRRLDPDAVLPSGTAFGAPVSARRAEAVNVAS